MAKKQVIVSTKNLIQNIGCVQGAYAQPKDHNYELSTSEIGSTLTSPEIVERDVMGDKIIVLKAIKLQKDLI